MKLEKQMESMQKNLNIPASASITCVKPSGTVSQLVDSASGIHARHNAQYIRTIRMDKKDPITDFLISAGVCRRLSNESKIYSYL
jgi:ribonucleoside-triphosphate reductase (thioredoxin)